ncbi:hypothetical protein GCM10025873_07310 [Demequina sediminis]|nr:hypothetical protein GCM10025873_07310 [Demequina sediminis]
MRERRMDREEVDAPEDGDEHREGGVTGGHGASLERARVKDKRAFVSQMFRMPSWKRVISNC